MRLTGQHFQHTGRIGGVGRFTEDDAVQHHLRVGRQHWPFGQHALDHALPTGGDLGSGHSFDVMERRLRVARTFDHVTFASGRFAQLQHIKVDAELAQ